MFTATAMWADTTLDPDQVWEEVEARGWTNAPPIEERSLEFTQGMASYEACGLLHKHDANCLRCGSAVRARKPNSLHGTWALIAAAATLYIPANVYPVLTVTQAEAGTPSTIMDGIDELLGLHMCPLTIIVFVVSVLVPVLKLTRFAITQMAIVLATTAAGANRFIVERTRLYHFVAWIGRWSMVDISIESLRRALVQFGTVVSMTPGTGAFCALVIITIVAAETCDPRAVWDLA